MMTSFRNRFSLGLSLAIVLSLLLAPLAIASSVDASVVDVTTPTSSVTLAPGGSGSITIEMTVTGNQVGTATFEVYRDWTLSGGTFTGSNPQEFTVAPRVAQDPATTFSTSGTVSVAASQTDGTFTLSVGVFDITNTNATGAKLGAGSSGSYDVTVVAPPASDTTAPVITYVLSPTSPDGSNGWYQSDVTLTWTVTEIESPSSLVKTGCVDQNITADQAETPYSCAATSDGGTAVPVSVSIKRDATAPAVSVTGVSNGAEYTLGSVPTAGCSTVDALSGVATEASLSSSGGPVGSVTATCSGALDNAGNLGSAAATYSVIYNWSGFFAPVDNLPTLNVGKAGSAIPVKFNLGGNQGLLIFTAGNPISTAIPCGTETVDNIEETITAGYSSLTYDAAAGQYVYVWKTDKAWAGTCRQFSFALVDGTTHSFNVKFTR